jgi:hypothetical protein
MTRIRIGTAVLAISSCAVVSVPNVRSQPQAYVVAPPPQQNEAEVAEQQRADVVRREFLRLLDQQPSTVREVFRIAPGLMLNREFTAPYPVLAQYIAEHPEIPQNPVYFVGRQISSANDLAEGLFAIGIFSAILFGLIWIIRTVIDYRRWSRLSRIQTEIHTKLLDRFTNMEDLQTYFNSSAGQRFLEAAPIDLGSESLRAAPAGRILWSLQVGIVLALGGAGLYLAIPGLTEQGLADPLRVVATIAIALGIGFVISAGASSILSSKMGLLRPTGKDAPSPRSG